MRILITGAAGTLGTALAPLLARAGHEPVLFDVVPIGSAHTVVAGDIRRPGDVARAVDGADIVVHAAALHGIHLAGHSRREFYDLNLTGTFNVLEAAVDAGVRGIVFSSTMGVYGDSGIPVRDDDVVTLHEETPLRPGDIYGYTKLAGEELCRQYVRKHQIGAIALRFGMFVPEPFFRYGVRLLYGGVDADDVARSVLASVEALAGGGFGFDAFNVHSLVPFHPQDAPGLRADPVAVLDRYYGDASALLRDRGVERLKPIQATYPMRRMTERLGLLPECNFDRWLEELRSRPGELAPVDAPWW